MGLFGMARSTPDGQLYNVTDSYTRALNASRAARGEPIDDAEKMTWRSEEWLNRHRLGISGGALFVFATIASFLILRLRAHSHERAAATEQPTQAA